MALVSPGCPTGILLAIERALREEKPTVAGKMPALLLSLASPPSPSTSLESNSFSFLRSSQREHKTVYTLSENSNGGKLQ